MKKVLSLTAITFALVAFMLTSCKKYPENDGMAFSSAKSRLCRTWNVDKVIENGIEYDAATAGMANQSIAYNRDGTFTASEGGISFNGTWEFGSKKETLVITITFFGMSASESIEILKLTKEELWAKITDGADTEEVHYVAS
ncbi:MAG: DUF4923 family protein [Bacteroidetes bacterium]|nr:DUF4923 family protein [Bacteroidota bacterium]MBU1719125.1 DUF4923 family protein [Bacteroidota bacterium]